MYDAEWQRREYPKLRAALASDAGIVAMGGGILGALDAQSILTTTPNSGIPAWFANYVDRDVLKILFAALKAAKIVGDERKIGDWTMATATFPIVEHTGNVSSYGDFNNNGTAGANATFPQRQSYHFQTILEYGERETDMMSLAGLNWVGEKKEGATRAINTYGNQTYFYGVKGLQNYGILNDPALPAAIAPSAKAYTGTQWVVNGVIKATPNEIFADIQTLFYQLALQSDGLIELDHESNLVLVMSPKTQIALTAANTFNVDVFDLLKKNFPNIRFETAVQYSTPAGELVQLIATDVEGQKTSYVAFTEKLRAHTVVRDLSSWRQKISQGTWGAINRQPFAFASMLGV